MTTSLARNFIQCVQCSKPMEPLAKFCGECGATRVLDNTNTYQQQSSTTPVQSGFPQAGHRAPAAPQPWQQSASAQQPASQGPAPQTQWLTPQTQLSPQFPQHGSTQPGQQQPVHYPPQYQQQSTAGPWPPQSHQQSTSGPLQPQYQQQQSTTGPLPTQVVVPNVVSYDDLAKLEAYRLSQFTGAQVDWHPTPSGHTKPLPPSGGAPTFAQVSTNSKLSPALVREMQTLNASIIRERMFLLMHCGIFLVCNLVGFYLALACYYGVHGDEVTKLVMALTPLTFINFVALACLAPIKGTRREIGRLIEKKQYVQFQMEYSGLMR